MNAEDIALCPKCGISISSHAHLCRIYGLQPSFVVTVLCNGCGAYVILARDASPKLGTPPTGDDVS